MNGIGRASMAEIRGVKGSAAMSVLPGSGLARPAPRIGSRKAAKLPGLVRGSAPVRGWRAAGYPTKNQAVRGKSCMGKECVLKVCLRIELHQPEGAR